MSAPPCQAILAQFAQLSKGTGSDLGHQFLFFCTNLPGRIRSFAETGEDLHLHFDSAKTSCGSRSGIRHRTIPADWICATVGRYFLHHVVNAVDWNTGKGRPQESRANQSGVTEEIVRDFQIEAAIDLACDQDRVLREHFPQTTRSHREEILPPDLEEIYEPRHLDQEEDEDDETENSTTFSEREKRELFRQHRNLGHPQPKELARALRHAGARQEALRFVLKELRCPTCEARPLPLPSRPGMLPRCLRF